MPPHPAVSVVQNMIMRGRGSSSSSYDATRILKLFLSELSHSRCKNILDLHFEIYLNHMSITCNLLQGSEKMQYKIELNLTTYSNINHPLALKHGSCCPMILGTTASYITNVKKFL
jgi:hypothetical protein